MTDGVRVETVERRYVATAQGRVLDGNVPAVAFPLSQLAWDFVRAHPEIPRTGINIWIYRCDGEPGFAVEPGAEVLEPFESDGAVVCSEAPAGRVAMGRNQGPYDGIPKVHEAIRNWAEANGETFEGTSWEVYGHHSDDPAALTTDIYYLLK